MPPASSPWLVTSPAAWSCLTRGANRPLAPGRPVRTKDRSDPSTYYGPGSRAVNSLVADGCIIEGEVENSILFRGVRVEKGPRSRMRADAGHRCSGRRGAQVRHHRQERAGQPGRMLMGHNTYPLSIAKNEIV
ncbi:MAG: hypothetical protein ACLRIS_02680 [Flavonifractor plautii]